jgi:hypothetical protein
MIIHAYKGNISTQLTFNIDIIEEANRAITQLEECGWRFDDKKVLELLDSISKQNAFKKQVG